MATEARCPDCDVELEAADLFTGQGEFRIRTEVTGDDVLSAVGVVEALDVTPRRCPECGLVRLYATDD